MSRAPWSFSLVAVLVMSCSSRPAVVVSDDTGPRAESGGQSYVPPVVTSEPVASVSGSATTSAPTAPTAPPTATAAPPSSAGLIVGAEGIAGFDALGKDALERLKKANVLFGHHGVGSNMIQGASASGVVFRKVNFEADYANGGFGSVSLVDSDDTRRKVKTFGSIALDQKLAAAADIVTFELGTAGFGESGKVSALREAYASHMDAMRAAFPKLRFVHITPPLTTGASKENRARQEISDWMKQTYGERDVVFDLGAVESTRPDGKPCQADRTRSLCGEYGSSDGRLGTEPAKRVAKAFLFALSRSLGTK